SGLKIRVSVVRIRPEAPLFAKACIAFFICHQRHTIKHIAAMQSIVKRLADLWLGAHDCWP
ncbi:hypothetical protein, partial [Sphingorhabdus sp.]|uniref:hypothetical protein n=1 Tax=Sphingorhabdus sp. TaxID=1902408 RepID=UPI002BA1CAA7